MESQDGIKPGRRWLQFSLRGLLVLTFLVAMGVGWIGNERRKVWLKDRAISEIRRLRGIVVSDPSSIGHNADLDQPASGLHALWRERLLGEKYEPIVEAVIFPPGASPEALAHLKHLPGLRHVDLIGACIGDESVEEILRVRSLEDLNLSATNITDIGVAKLASLPRLEKLALDHTTVTDRSLDVLDGLPLTRLSVGDTNVSPARAERFEAEHPDMGQFVFAPCPSREYRDAAIHLVRAGATVERCRTPQPVWQGLTLRSGKEKEDRSYSTHVELNWHSWGGGLDDLVWLGELGPIQSLQVYNPVGFDEELLRTVCRHAALCRLELGYGQPLPLPASSFEPLTESTIEDLCLEFDWFERQNLDFLAEMKSLRCLTLRNYSHRRLPDRSVQCLPDCASLETLVLEGVGLSEETVAVFAECEGLKNLVLRYAVLDEAAQARIRCIQSLRALSIDARCGFEVPHVNLVQVGVLPALEELDLRCRFLAEEELDVLAQCTNLRRLGLVFSGVDDHALRRIAALENLEYLQLIDKPFLVGTKRQGKALVSPAALERVRKLPKLREVEVVLNGGEL